MARSMIKFCSLNYETQCADRRGFKFKVEVEAIPDILLKNLFPDGFDPGNPKIFMEAQS